jgi:hypothetical protein
MWWKNGRDTAPLGVESSVVRETVPKVDFGNRNGTLSVGELAGGVSVSSGGTIWGTCKYWSSLAGGVWGGDGMMSRSGACAEGGAVGGTMCVDGGIVIGNGKGVDL